MDNPNKEWRDADPMNINVTDENKTNDSAVRVSPWKWEQGGEERSLYLLNPPIRQLRLHCWDQLQQQTIYLAKETDPDNSAKNKPKVNTYPLERYMQVIKIYLLYISILLRADRWWRAEVAIVNLS